MLAEEIKNIKSDKKEFRKFGLTVGTVLSAAGLLLLYFAKAIYIYFSAAGLTLVLLGVFIPAILKPLHKAWMVLAVILGFFMSRVILLILYYLVVTPTGFITKLLGKDFLSLGIDRKAGTYWIDRSSEIYEKKSTEKQF